MRFLIITHVLHKKKGAGYTAYAPYVREMNLWLRHVDEVEIVAPLVKESVSDIDLDYQHEQIKFTKIPFVNLTTVANSILAFLKLPIILWRIVGACKRSDHIHLRCPGNIGLLGCFVQVLFPKKIKTAKYAGNWDPRAKQPWSYKLQRSILKNQFLTKNMTALVYGNWNDSYCHIKPFFTASYNENEKEDVDVKSLSNAIDLLFVGTLSPGKQPLISVRVVEQLITKGFKVRLNIYGDGSERKALEDYISNHNLSDKINLHGNAEKEVVKQAYKNSHFLILMSKSEGWPKVVAEAMFWKCLPISTAVSCVPQMLGNGIRGSIVSEKVSEIVTEIENYVNDENAYQTKIENAFSWSRNYTLDKLEQEIEYLLKK